MRLRRQELTSVNREQQINIRNVAVKTQLSLHLYESPTMDHHRRNVLNSDRRVGNVA